MPPPYAVRVRTATGWQDIALQGPPGPAGEPGPSGQAAGKIFYLATSDPSDISGYKTLLQSPSTGPEQNIVTVCTGVTDFLVASFATDPAVPGAVDYPAGTALRRIYAMVNGGVARLHLQVFKRSDVGVETLIRDEFSENFSDLTASMQMWTASATAAGALLATDRIVAKLYAQRVSGGAGNSVTVTTFYEGTAHSSQIQTTITVGAQGPPGPGGGDVTYVHTQLSPSASWTITHSLGKYPSVTVVDSGGTVIDPDVLYVDTNRVTVSFGSITSGKAYLN